MTKMHVTENRRNTPLSSLFTTRPLPRRMVIGMVGSQVVRGNFGLSPFNFEYFNIADIKITSGVNTFPNTPYRLDFNRGQCLRPFMQLFDGLGIPGDDRGNMIG